MYALVLRHYSLTRTMHTMVFAFVRQTSIRVLKAVVAPESFSLRGLTKRSLVVRMLGLHDSLQDMADFSLIL